MKAIVKSKAEEGLWLEEVPIPEIGDKDVLVKVRKSAICGTDVHIYKWDAWSQKNVPVPLIIGHEFMGEVVELGKSVTDISVGDRVSAEGHITCGICPNCRTGKKHLCMNTRGIGYHTNGTFAEYAAIPAENIFKLPNFIADDIAAVFDPFGNAVHTALCFPLAAEDVLITGAGPIGIMAAAIAKKAGARNVVVTDVNQYRLDLAHKMGATTVVNVATTNLKKAMESINIEHGFTVGLEMSGNRQAFCDMLENMRHGGNIALLGILPPDCTIDWDLVIFKMLNIKGIYGREIFSTWYQMTHLVESGLDISPMITHHYRYEDFEKGFEAIFTGQSGKVILDW
ncbi:MAG: L-threonine 3-dehydrogenase [Chlamydiota bacterium]|nr:L-threonine 3-dehydrogenase [Chlamydiota bacterium]